MSILLRGVLAMATLLVLGTEARAEGSRLLSDFPAGARDLPWDVVNDNVMGGRSKGSFRLTETSLLFTGSTNTRGGGFSSIRSRTGSFDLEGYEGIRLRVRGDGRTYTFRLTTSDSRRGRMRPSYWAEFETLRGQEWQEIDVPFSTFRPQWRGRRLSGPALNLEAIDSLGLMIYDKRDGPFRIEVDWIRAYEPQPTFSIEDYRRKRRPLVLFAPDGNDARLKRQLEQVRQTREAFDARDMLLVVVLGTGTSQADGEDLTQADAARLRERFGVKSGEFAMRLVGKDGGVKQASSDVTWMTSIYTLIDAMPMRRSEASRRSAASSMR